MSSLPELPLSPTHLHACFPLPIPLRTIRRLALTARMMPTAKGVAVGTVHLTMVIASTWDYIGHLCPGMLFSCLAHALLPAAGLIQLDTVGSSRAEAAHPFAGPCQHCLLPGAGQMPPHGASPFLPQRDELSAPSCSQETASTISPGDAFWFNEQRLF